MENRIYYGEYSLAYWIELILTKQLILPPYQRYYVWSQSKLKTLVDSLINKRFVPPVTIGSFVKEGKRVNYIIDGQQRLTSILLAYLNRFPNREYYKATDGLLAGSVEPLDSEDATSTPLDDVLHWRFDKLTEKGGCAEDILKALNSEQYYRIYKGDETTPINSCNASKLFIGFSYIVPSTDDVEKQLEYYTKVFRDINQQASPLLLTESRKSLYFLKEGLDGYFDPDFVRSYGVQPVAGPKQTIDFCRFLCFIAAYKKARNARYVARGYSYDIEPYIINYINSVVSGENESQFGKFSDTFSDGDFTSHMQVFEEMLTQLDIPYTFNSIINMDVYFFGLVYFTLFEKKFIDITKKEQLTRELKKVIRDLKSNVGHTANPAQFQYMRMRITKSIETYQKYIVHDTPRSVH